MVEKAAIEAGFKVVSPVKIERPEKETHGDYSSNFAMQVASNFKMAPKYIADNIRSHILNLRPGLFEKVEVVDPGFINFFVSRKYLQDQLSGIIKEKDKYGQLEAGRGKKANIELISANPTGQLHIGNGRNAFAGDVLANILNKAGFKVTREYFINDAGNSKQINELGKTVLGKGESYLTDYLRSKIELLKPKLEKVKSESEAGVLVAASIQKDNQEFIEKKLGIRVDNWVSEEKAIYKKNKVEKMFKWLKEKQLVYQKEGACPPKFLDKVSSKNKPTKSVQKLGRAWWIKTSQFGDEKDWVVVRETGQPTYLLSDIAYHKDKMDRGFDKIIDIWGADHQGHVQKMKSVGKMLGYEGDLEILVLQLVTLKSGEKLSKRKGEIVTLEKLVDEIGLDAARFFYLQKSLNTHMDIDLALAKEQSTKNPVFYVQYAHARICSILEKAKADKKFSQDLLNHPSELKLIKELLKFPELIEDTAQDYQLQRLPAYALELSAAFHQFYHDCRVIPALPAGRSENKKLTKARLSLALAAKIVLKNALDLMGISAPSKM